MEREMRDFWAETTYDKFMASFVPGDDPSPEIKVTFAKFEDEVDFSSGERGMYSGLCRTLQSALSDECGLVARDTGEWPEKADKGKKDKKDKQAGCRLKPDIGIYSNIKQAEEAYKLAEEELTRSKNQSVLDDREYTMSRVAWAWLCVALEVKPRDDKSPFGTKPNTPFLRDSDDARRFRGQLADYAAQILMRQHRVSCFTIAVYGHIARLLRWDRVGAVVSEPFNYVEEPDKLLTFVYRFGRMTRAQQGYDPTAVLATESEAELFRTCAAPLDAYRKQYLKDALAKGWPIHKVHFRPEDFLKAEREEGGDFLIGKARFQSPSPVGRGTRGWIAMNIATGRLYFLKDSWRVDSTKIRTEREVYERLYAKNVCNIATLICAGDVGETLQRTRSQEFITNCTLYPRIHYRMVVKEIGRPLEEYVNSLEMMRVVRDALCAHRDAWENAEVLHRDISVGNILIDDDPDGVEPDSKTGVKLSKGFLNDWDLCKYKEDLGKGSTQKERTGTWQFMSALLVNYPKKPHEVSDDLESFVHVVNWLALRYHSHTMGPLRLSDHVSAMYDALTIEEGYHFGGRFKQLTVSSGDRAFKLLPDISLNDLLDGMALICKQHYDALNQDALSKYAVNINRDRPEDPPRRRPVRLLADLASASHAASSNAPVARGCSTLRPTPLSDHTVLLNYFNETINLTDDLPDKVKDQFCTFNRSGTPRSGRKRKSQADSSGSSEPKRSRSGGSTAQFSSYVDEYAPQLAKIPEDADAENTTAAVGGL